MSDELFITVAEAARRAGLSRAFFYPLVMRGEVPSVKFGRARRVPVAGLERWAADCLQSATTADGRQA